MLEYNEINTSMFKKKNTGETLLSIVAVVNANVFLLELTNYGLAFSLLYKFFRLFTIQKIPVILAFLSTYVYFE